MVTLEQIREDLEKKLKADQILRFVDVTADTLDDALSDAAIQLEITVGKLEYEVIEKGSDGILGLMKKPWHIRAYENAESVSRKKRMAQEAGNVDGTVSEVEENKNRDGEAFIHYFGSQVQMKVVLPVGEGSPVKFADVIVQLKKPEISDIEENSIKEYLEKGTNGEYEPVASYDHVQANDAVMSVEVSDDEMKVSIVVSAPLSGGAEIAANQIERQLSIQGVSVGIDKEKIIEFVDKPIYGAPYIVAQGLVPVDGRDAYIAYNFETDRSRLKLKESETGQVNFKELNLIQNVVEGQPLAQKMPAERGKAGKTVYGKYLEAKNGKDIPLPLGKNVAVDTDGTTILATTNGQVLLVGNKINVEPVMQIEGDVSIKTGNITFLGTVIVTGNVDDGFDIKASGNIEVYGAVGKCKLDAEGDIVVSGGIMGRDEGYVHAGKSLWAKFIQQATVDVEELIIVADGIINSNVTSNKKILVQGKRAAIIGGHLFATEEIHAKNIGSNGGGSETILEVGFNPKSKRRIEELNDLQDSLAKELEDIDANLLTLENQKKMRRALPPEKEEAIVKYNARKNEIADETEEYAKEIQEIQEYLRNLKIVGKVSASGVVYPGVKIYIRDQKEEIRNEVKSVTFFLENSFVRHGKYEGPSDDAKKVPDGYSAN